jgi:hypothetical protein
MIQVRRPSRQRYLTGRLQRRKIGDTMIWLSQSTYWTKAVLYDCCWICLILVSSPSKHVPDNTPNSKRRCSKEEIPSTCSVLHCL